MQSRNIRAYSVVSSPFRVGFLIMAKTLLEQNAHHAVSFRVLYHPELSPLPLEHREWIASRVPNVEFVEVDLAPYSNIFQLRDRVFQTPRRLWAAFFVLDSFRDDSTDADVLCLDSDMICMGPLEDDLFVREGFGAVEALSRAGAPRGFFNTGVMSIARDARGHDAFMKIMGMKDARGYHPDSGRADQAVMSLIYTPKNAICLPSRYNLTRRSAPTSNLEEYLARERCVFFHYVGSKPWHVSVDERDTDDTAAVALWDRTVRRHLSDADYVAYLEEWRDVSRRKAKEYVAEVLARPKGWAALWSRVQRLAARLYGR